MADASFCSPPSSPLSALDSIPSSPLSVRSRSPTPPLDYPSPSRSSDSRSSSKERAMHFSLEPPAKKRRTTSAKGFTTDYLDLGRLDESPDSDDGLNLQRLLHTLRRKKKIVVIAGAGISVSAGIPDFRSDTGLFKTLRAQHNLKSSGKDLFDASVYKDDSATASFHDMVREMSHQTRAAEPTPFHHMLATIAEEGRLLRLYTQNVDGIDTRLEPLATSIPLEEKGPWPKTIQLHGGLDKMVCSKCGDLSDFDAELFEGVDTPPCKACEELDEVRAVCGKRSHGIGRLRPRMVLYNEYNPDQDAIGAVTTADLKSRPDAVIVVGTSLKIPGVRRMASEMCKVARGRKDGFTAWINNSDEPSGPEFQDCWDLVINGDSDEVARHAALPKWDDKDVGEYVDVTNKKAQKALIKIEIERKAVESIRGMVTPSASPRKGTPVPVVIEPKKTMRQQKLFEDKKPRTALPTKPATILPTVKAVPAKRKASTTSAILPPKKKTAAKKAAPAKSTSKITDAFTATKTAKVTSGKPSKLSPILPSTKDARPTVAKLEKAEPMQPIRPRDIRSNSNTGSNGIRLSNYAIDNITPTSAICTNKSKPFEIEIPESPQEDPSPSTQLRWESTRGERITISPKGALPSGMAHLLDL